MTFVHIYDAVVRAFRWPVITNAIVSAIGVPVILATGIIPPEALNQWTWISAGLAGTLFILAVPDMRNQWAVMATNAILFEDFRENGYGSQWSRRLGPDRLPSILIKFMFIEYAIMILIGNMMLTIHLFAALFGLVCLVMTSMKYDPEIQERLAVDNPGQTGPALPGKRIMARLWVFSGLMGIGIIAAIAVACLAFGLTFYYHFGPHYGEAVEPDIIAAILATLALAFALLTLRGWLTLRNPSTSLRQ